MFGVILWRDEQEQKAVIWCEDHGDLAFYQNTGACSEFEFDTGDWVQFEMTMGRKQRYAHNPRLVSEGVYPGLADELCAVNTKSVVQKSTPSTQETVQIIPFSSAQTLQQRKARPLEANRA